MTTQHTATATTTQHTMTTQHTTTTMTYQQAYDHLLSTIDEWFLIYLDGETFNEFCESIEPIINDMISELKDKGVKVPTVVVLDVLRQWHNTQETKAMQLHPDNF